MSKKVYLSPSTQEKNIGAGNYGTEEYRMNQLADVIEDILKKHGVEVKRNNPNMSLYEVVTDSNNFKPDLHFSPHSNAYDKESRGCEVFCWKLGQEGEKIAKIIYDELSNITPTSDRGVKQGYNYFGEGKHLYELANTKAIACLAEVAFHDNSSDALWIINNINLIGKVISKGILKYLGIDFIDVDNTNITLMNEINKLKSANNELNILVNKLVATNKKLLGCLLDWK